MGVASYHWVAIFWGKKVSLFIPTMRLLNKLVAAFAINLHGKEHDFQGKHPLADLRNNC